MPRPEDSILEELDKRMTVEKKQNLALGSVELEIKDSLPSKLVIIRETLSDCIVWFVKSK